MAGSLKKDRKEPELKALRQSEKLTKELIKVLNYDNILPKRQRHIFRNIIAKYGLEVYENLRAANI